MKCKRYFIVMLFIMGIFSIINMIINYSIVSENINIHPLLLGGIVFFAGAISWAFDVFVVSLVTYFCNAFMGEIIKFSEIVKFISKSMMVLPYYVIINTLLAVLGFDSILNDRGIILKIIYLPMYLVFFMILGKKLYKKSVQRKRSFISAFFSTLTLFLITGI